MMCDKCGERVATIHISRMLASGTDVKTIKEDLCAVCGAEALNLIPKSGSSGWSSYDPPPSKE